MKIILTFENKSTEVLNIPSGYSMKMAGLEYLNAWRPQGVVAKVRKAK